VIPNVSFFSGKEASQSFGNLYSSSSKWDWLWSCNLSLGAGKKLWINKSYSQIGKSSFESNKKI